MKKHLPLIAWCVAIIGIVLATCMFFVEQGAATSNWAETGNQLADGTAAAILEATRAGLTTGWQNAFESGMQGYYLIIFLGSVVSVILLILAKFVPYFKKLKVVFYTMAATLILVNVALLLNNISLLNFRQESLDATTTAALGKAFITLGGSWAFFVGLAAQILTLVAVVYIVITTVRNKEDA